MARIRSQPSATLDNAKHELVETLVKVLKDDEPVDGLVIFEVSSGSSDFFEVIAIWDRWADLPAEARNKNVSIGVDSLDPLCYRGIQFARATVVLPPARA